MHLNYNSTTPLLQLPKVIIHDDGYVTPIVSIDCL